MRVVKFWPVGDNDDETPKNQQLQRRVIVLSVALVTALIVMVTTLALLLKNDWHRVSASEMKSSLDTAPIAPPTSSTDKLNSSIVVAPMPSELPSLSPVPSSIPSLEYSELPSSLPSLEYSDVPSSLPTLINATFMPGFLTTAENNLLLSQGLRSRILAETGKHVTYSSGNKSASSFHERPDFGATFPDPRNPGGWIYVSNSEVKDFEESPQKGGVGALTFDAEGNLLDYRMILEGSKANCGGGKTPWGAWISCEEHGSGVIWQVDPTGEREAQVITLGSSDGGGAFESFTWHESHYFVTEDAEAGPLRRFTPSIASDGPFDNETDPWSILLGPGLTEYLLLSPTNDSSSGGTYDWTTNKDLAKENSRQRYQNTEGIDAVGDQLFFVSKAQRELFTLDLSSNRYIVESTVNGLFDGQPDQVVNIVGDDELLFFTEEGGAKIGGTLKSMLGLAFSSKAKKAALLNFRCNLSHCHSHLHLLSCDSPCSESAGPIFLHTGK